MTSDEFRDLLEHQSDKQLLDPCLREDGPPFVFEPMPDAWDSLRDELVSDPHLRCGLQTFRWLRQLVDSGSRLIE